MRGQNQKMFPLIEPDSIHSYRWLGQFQLELHVGGGERSRRFSHVMEELRKESTWEIRSSKVLTSGLCTCAYGAGAPL